MATLIMSIMKQSSCFLEITVLSAQGLKDSPFLQLLTYSRLRPFTTVTISPPPPPPHDDDDANLDLDPAPTKARREPRPVYKTKVDYRGGVNPVWGDEFRLPLHATFFDYQTPSCIYLQVYTKHLFFGRTQLGWCQIPVSDILDGLLPAGSLRHLGYRLRARDGTRGHGIVNVTAKVGLYKL